MTHLKRTLVLLMTFTCLTHSNAAWAQGEVEKQVSLRRMMMRQMILTRDLPPIANRNGIEAFSSSSDHFSIYYRSTVNDLNDLLSEYSQLKKDKHTVILMPGLGQYEQDAMRTYDFQWQLRIPTNKQNFKPDKRIASDLIIYIPNACYQSKVDEKAVAKWIIELDSDDFKTRQAAEMSLQPLAKDAKTMLRDALNKSTSAEQRLRIYRLLDPLKGFDTTDLMIPKNVQLLDVDDLVSQYQCEIEKAGSRALKNGESEPLSVWNHIRSSAIELAKLHPYRSDVIPYLTKLLAPENRFIVRINAAKALAEIGRNAESALPTLKLIADSKSDDAVVSEVCEKTIGSIYEGVKTKITEETKKQNSIIMKDIKELKQKSSKQ